MLRTPGLFALSACAALAFSSMKCDGRDASAKPPKAAEAAPAAAPAPTATQAGFADGKVTQSDGKPITAPGASISVAIRGISEAGQNVSYTPVVKADGTYHQKLTPGTYGFTRSLIEVKFEGKVYRFELTPVGDLADKSRESAAGITQDFVWNITGEHDGSDHNPNNATNWYGGTIGVRCSGYRNDLGKKAEPLPGGTDLTFTLKPTTATRIDGAAAKTLILKRKIDPKSGECDSLNDIPPAFYEMTGVAALADGSTKPLVFEVEYAKFKPAQPVRFEPDRIMNHVTRVLTTWGTD